MSDNVFERLAHAVSVMVIRGEQAVSEERHGVQNGKPDRISALEHRVAELESRVQAA